MSRSADSSSSLSNLNRAMIRSELKLLAAFAHISLCHMIVAILRDIEREVALEFSAAAASFYSKSRSFRKHDVDGALMIAHIYVAERCLGMKINLSMAVLNCDRSRDVFQTDVFRLGPDLEGTGYGVRTQIAR